MGRRYLLRVPELVPRGEDKSLDCPTSGPVHWRGLWDGKEPWISGIWVGMAPGKQLTVKRESRWGKCLIRPFKPSKLLSVSCPPSPLRCLSQPLWLWVKSTKASLAVVFRCSVEILFFYLPMGNTCPRVWGETYPGWVFARTSRTPFLRTSAVSSAALRGSTPASSLLELPPSAQRGAAFQAPRSPSRPGEAAPFAWQLPDRSASPRPHRFCWESPNLSQHNLFGDPPLVLWSCGTVSTYRGNWHLWKKCFPRSVLVDSTYLSATVDWLVCEPGFP